MDHIIAPAPHEFWGLPPTAWGISYDIFTRPTEQNLPLGWNSHRANTYRQLSQMLNEAGHLRHQYSDYLNPDTDAITTWDHMIELMNIHPFGKMETTVKGLKMYTMDRVHLQDVSNKVQLGGEFIIRLRGPTPRSLVVPEVAAVLNPPPQIPHPLNFVLPRHTRPSPRALNPNNWLV